MACRGLPTGRNQLAALYVHSKGQEQWLKSGQAQWLGTEVLTFLPAWRRARASSVEMVLFPTPPFPERTRMICWMPARFPGSAQKGKRGDPLHSLLTHWVITHLPP